MVSVSLVSPSIQTMTTVLFSTSTAASVLATTQPLTSVQVQAISQSPQPSSGDFLMPIAIGVVVIVVIAIAAFLLIKGKKPKST
jgi:carbohydrate-binding DOMON domain-containing protein